MGEYVQDSARIVCGLFQSTILESNLNVYKADSTRLMIVEERMSFRRELDAKIG